MGGRTARDSPPSPNPKCQGNDTGLIPKQISQSEQTKPKPIQPQPNPLQASQSSIPKPYWEQQQAYQSPLGEAHCEQVDGYWPSWEDEENLSQNDSGPRTAPQAQTDAESTATKGNDKKETPAAEKPEDARKED